MCCVVRRVVTAGMEILQGGVWVCMRRTDDNYFTADGLGELKFPLKIRVTSISNEQLESTIQSLQNDVNIPSGVQYSGFLPGKGLLTSERLCNEHFQYSYFQ